MSQERGVESEKVLGKAYDAKLFKRIWQFVRPHWKLLLISLVMMPITVGFEVAQPYILKVAIDDYITQFKLNGLEIVALVYVALVVMQAMSGFVQLICLQLLGQRSMHDLRVTTYKHVINQRSAFFDRMPVGRLLTRMTNDVESINEMFASGVVTVIADVIKLILIVTIMLALNWKLTLITFMVLPVLLIVVEWSRRLMRKSFRKIRVKLAEMNAFTQEHLSGIKVIQLFCREKKAGDDYDKINGDYRDAYLGSIRADATMYAMVEAIGVVSVACIAYYAGGEITKGALTVGLVIAFIEYVNKFYIPVRDLSAKYAVMQSGMAAAERIVELLDTHEPDAGASATVSGVLDDNHQLGDDTASAVSFDDVHFAYRANEPVLRGVDFELEKGYTVAVVGATGSGKSTIIKLLTRLYEIDKGAIQINGVALEQLDVAALRRRITVVSQDVFLFAGTVSDNVRLGNPDATDEQISAALHRVGADRMLSRRQSTEDEQVAERGENFSAGERQLVAFARALVRDPEILVLDEATAHVDPEAEAWIEEGLSELMRGRTTLVIAHRLSTIRSADRILVIDHGRVVESGNHEELLAANGLYAKLERTFSRTQ